MPRKNLGMNVIMPVSSFLMVQQKTVYKDRQLHIEKKQMR